MPVLNMRYTVGSSGYVTDERPKQFRLGILDEYANHTPLCKMIMAGGNEKEVSTDPEIAWWERTFTTRELTVAAGDTPGASTAGTADTMKVGSNEAYHCVVGTLIYNPYTDEMVRVTSVTDDDDLAIVRGIGLTGGTAVSAWTASQKVQVVGQASAEGATAPAAVAYDPTKKYNYLQVFKRVSEASGTALATKLRSVDEKIRRKKETLLYHMVDLEWSLLAGKRSEDTTGVVRTTGGLLDANVGISTNVKDFSSTFTSDGFRDFVSDVAARGDNEEYMLVCGKDLLLCLEAMARAESMQIYDVPTKDSFGLRLRRMEMTMATIYIKEHRLLSRSTELTGWGFLIPPGNIIYRPLKGRDTTFEDISTPGTDGEKVQWLTEAGWEIHNEYQMGVIKNADTYGG